MNDDVRAMFDRAAEIWCRHGVVDDQRHARLVRHFGDRGYVGDDPTRIGERFDEDRAGVLVNGGGEGGGIVGVDEAAFPAHLAKALAKMVARAAIELVQGPDFSRWAQYRGKEDDQDGGQEWS